MGNTQKIILTFIHVLKWNFLKIKNFFLYNYTWKIFNWYFYSIRHHCSRSPLKSTNFEGKSLKNYYNFFLKAHWRPLSNYSILMILKIFKNYFHEKINSKSWNIRSSWICPYAYFGKSKHQLYFISRSLGNETNCVCNLFGQLSQSPTNWAGSEDLFHINKVVIHS